VLATATLFGLFHGSLVRVGETFIVGFFAGVIYLRTGSFMSAVAFHAMSNAVAPALFLLPEFKTVAGPLGAIPAMALTIAGAVLLDPAPVRSVRGWTGKLKCALFCTSLRVHSRADRPQSRLLFSAIVVLWSGLLWYDHLSSSKMRKLPPARFAGTQYDTWHLEASDSLRVVSRLSITRHPRDSAPGFEFALPYINCVVASIRCGASELTYAQVDSQKYAVDIPESCLSVDTSRITLEWRISLRDLGRSSDGFVVHPKSFIPVTSYRLQLRISKGSRYMYVSDPSKSCIDIYSEGHEKPRFVGKVIAGLPIVIAR
jgi:hypothetical protein